MAHAVGDLLSLRLRAFVHSRSSPTAALATFVPERSLTSARPPGRAGTFPYNRRDAPHAPRQDRSCSAQARARRVPDRPRAVPRGAAGGARADVLARHLRAARRAPAAGARGARSDLRQVRPDALDAARPLAAGHRRRAREAAGPRAAVSLRAGDGDADAALRQAGGRGLPVVRQVPIASASVAQVHFAELPDGTPVAVKVLRPNIAPGDREGHLAHARGRDAGREAVVATASGCGRARSSPSSRRRCATSST